jgi:hypothetical protein
LEDVSDYHSLAISDPQKINTNLEHESNAKIFFHGRLFCLRSKKYWSRAPSNSKVAGDDSYLPDYIICNYGKNKIRVRYDAIVYFEPYTSLTKHYKSYKRIYYDLLALKTEFPQFQEIRKKSVLCLDENYISTLDLKVRILFSVYKLVKIVEKFLFKLSNETNPKKLWK